MSVKEALEVLMRAVAQAEEATQPNLADASNWNSATMRDWTAIAAITDALRRAEELYQRGVIKEVINEQNS